MTIYAIGPFHLRAERLVLEHAGKMVPLGPKAIETLLALVEHAGKVVSKEALMERLWPRCFVEEGNLAQNVYVLRKTFRSYGAGDPIETIPSVGYRLAATARRLPELPELTQPQWRAPLPRWGTVVAVAGAVALAIASLALVIAHGSDQRSSSPTLSDEPARLYAIGRYYWNLRTSDGVQKACVISHASSISLQTVRSATPVWRMPTKLWATTATARIVRATTLPERKRTQIKRYASIRNRRLRTLR